MTMYSYIISSLPAKINLETNIGILEDILSTKIFANEIANFNIYEGEELNCWTLKYQNRNTHNLEYLKDQKEIKYFGQYNENCFIWDILHLSKQLIERTYLENNMFSLHSSTISLDDKYVLILGAPLSGKTTIATYACLEKSFSFVSGERTLLSSNEILGGTKTIALRNATIDLYLPMLCQYKKRRTLDPAEIGINLARSGKLSLIIYPKLCNNKGHIFLMSKPMIRMLLYEDSSSIINGNFLLSEQRIPVQSLDKDVFRVLRAKTIEKISDKVNAYFVEGDLEFIVNFIMDKL